MFNHLFRQRSQLQGTEMLENQILREEVGKTNEPVSSGNPVKFEWKAIIIGLGVVIGFELIRPGSWFLSGILVILILINHFLDTI